MTGSLPPAPQRVCTDTDIAGRRHGPTAVAASAPVAAAETVGAELPDWPSEVAAEELAA